MAPNLNPSFRQEDQEQIENEGVGDAEVIGPPAYASPDPRTMMHSLVPVERHAGKLSPDYGAGQGDTLGTADTMTVDTEPDEDKNPDDDYLSADWIELIEAADNEAELNDVRARYDASDHKAWSSVEKAFTDKYDDLND